MLVDLTARVHCKNGEHPRIAVDWIENTPPAHVWLPYPGSFNEWSGQARIERVISQLAYSKSQPPLSGTVKPIENLFSFAGNSDPV